MDTHRHSAMELHQRKNHKRQQWHMPKGLVADTRPLRGRRRWGGSQGVRLLVLIGLFGLLGWGTAPPQAQDLLQPPSPPPQAPEPSRHATRQVPYGQLPLSFEANQGQTDSQVQFLAHSQGYTLFLTAREAVFNFRPPAAYGQRPTRLVPRTSAVQDAPDTARAVVRMQLLEANPAPQVVGLEDLPGKANYFRSNDPQQWRTNVPTYAKVKYAAVYPGVDLVYYGQSRQLEYDFVVAPGADPAVITLGFEGVDHVDVDAQGDLVLSTASGSLRFQKPVIYQEEDGRRHAIAGSYVRKGPHQVGFQLAAYDAIHPLTIDPVLSYATYLGGSGFDFGQGIAVDAAGQAYVTVGPQSPDFPTVHPLQRTLDGGEDAFVAKLTADGTALVYATYLGGSGNDSGQGIAVDAASQAYVTELTSSPDFPTVHPRQPAFGGGGFNDAFVAKLNAAGAALVYATYLGGSGDDAGVGIAVDAAGAAYVTGFTQSLDFPTVHPLQPVLGGGVDAFVAKITPASDFFLHGSGATANPPALFLDDSAPTGSTAKYKDSTSINFVGGNAWKDVGSWAVSPTSLTSGSLTALSDLHVWLGLQNSDDQGTNFDLRAEVSKNGALVASGLTRCITGVTRNPSLAKEVPVAFGAFSAVSFNGTSDVLSLKLSTRIGTNPNDTKCAGHNNAVGLRVYFDATNREAEFDATFASTP